MTHLVQTIHKAVHYFMACLMWPLQFLPPFWSLAAISFLAGILMLWIFGRVSSQSAIKRVKDRISAQLLAIRLFDDRVSVFLKTELRLLGHVLLYMKHSFVPMLAMIIPVFLLLVQLNLFYAVRPFEAGETFIVKVITEHSSDVGRVTLRADPGIVLDTLPVRIPSAREISWRLKAEEPGRHRLVVSAGTHMEEKEVLVETGFGPISTMRTTGALAMMLSPGEPLLEKTRGLQSIHVAYPDAELVIWGWQVHWLAVFFVLSILFAFLFKGFFGVEI